VFVDPELDDPDPLLDPGLELDPLLLDPELDPVPLLDPLLLDPVLDPVPLDPELEPAPVLSPLHCWMTSVRAKYRPMLVLDWPCCVSPRAIARQRARNAARSLPLPPYCV
jgi:hypothetical protein